jgi:hypothetical protein
LRRSPSTTPPDSHAKRGQIRALAGQPHKARANTRLAGQPHKARVKRRLIIQMRKKSLQTFSNTNNAIFIRAKLLEQNNCRLVKILL